MRVTALPVLLPESELLTEPKVHAFSVRGCSLTDEECRLDASFYAHKATAARRVAEDSGYTIAPLGNLSESIFHPARFKRDWRDAKHGMPFLGGMEILYLRPPKEKWLSPKQVKRLNLAVKHGWVLVTCSGTIGRTVFVSRSLHGWAVSQHVIRIVPANGVYGGFLFAYLTTWMGQALMLRGVYGGSIPEIEPDHLATIPVPLLPHAKQREIHDQITKAYRLRDEANDLLDQADELLHAKLGLPRFDESQVSYFGGVAKPKAFAVKMSELAERLDASFHAPIAKAAVQQLRGGRYPLVRLEDVAERIFIPPRFKRIYVSPQYGVPFLQGSHIPLVKPYDLKYLSRRANERYIGECLIHTGWILLTRSGTVGRLMLVPSALEAWAASEHCLRIIANSELVHPGYLAAFLMTPYGQCQLLSKIYGGVVDELTEDDTAAVWLPNAPQDVQRRIGTLIIQAFDKKEEANQIEEQAISALEKTITKSR